MEPRTVSVFFAATGDTRRYVASDDAPIRRAAFRPGDTIVAREHGEATVGAVSERDGLLYYYCGGREVCETELSHTLSFSSPLERLFAAQFDPSSVFDLRAAALGYQAQRRRSDVRGFVGGRIDLLPHQLGIAAEVTGRLIPRVLLADEVGLGKTIEACLIVHRLLTTGRARRVLVIVPETLVHQWFLELLRRFNLWFHIFNEARCVAVEESNPDANPFLDDQLVLCELSLFTGHEERLDQALAAGWDMVVVDEAHHLEWSPAAASPEYAAVERLARASQGLLLLTATPEQLGLAGHFARLRLLDPDRFYDLDQFTNESKAYEAVARLARLLREGQPLSGADALLLARLLDESGDGVAATLSSGDAAAREGWIERLLDQHGTGRVMFRNTRATIAGFPPRTTHLSALTATSSTRREAIANEWDDDTAVAGDGGNALPGERQAPLSFAHDPRIEWLVPLLQALAPQKVLLICRTQRKALAIESALRLRTTIPLAAFHEGLTLVQRDRGAASFADPDGARLLICSEIGSEGRNFQFAHHLVLFDLPLDPALLEQRIGRLDRIGQREPIHIHVPYVAGTHLEVLARWYHEGLDAFRTHLPGARELLEQFEPELRALAAGARHDRRRVGIELEGFLAAVRAAREGVARRLEQGRDRLLEWNSLRPALATHIADEIRRQDEDTTLDEFMLSVFDLFVLQVEEVAPRTYRLGSAGVLVDDFPGLKADGLTCTRDRQRALRREDLQFLTWDHPLATGALDMLLGTERGNCSFARWSDTGASALYLEALYVLESLAPDPVHVDRFLPPTPLRVAVDHRGRDAGALLSPDRLRRRPDGSAGSALLSRAEVRDSLLPRMVEATRALAEGLVAAIVDRAQQAMRARLQHETARLRELQKVNRTVRDEEIELLVAQEQTLARHIDDARLRLDAVRLIYRGR